METAPSARQSPTAASEPPRPITVILIAAAMVLAFVSGVSLLASTQAMRPYFFCTAEMPIPPDPSQETSTECLANSERRLAHDRRQRTRLQVAGAASAVAALGLGVAAWRRRPTAGVDDGQPAKRWPGWSDG